MRTLLETVLLSFDDELAVLRYSAAIVFVLAEATGQAETPDDQVLPETALSPYFHGLVAKLLQRAGAESDLELQVTCYDVVSQLIKFSADDVQDQVHALLPHLCAQLEQSVAVAASLAHAHAAGGGGSMERLEGVANMQSQMVSALHTMLIRMEPVHIGEHATRLVDAFVAILSSATVATASTVGEEALQAVGELARKALGAFLTYLPKVQEPLQRALRDPSNTHLCVTAVYTLSRVCCALEGVMTPAMIDPLMDALFFAFAAEDNVDRQVKSAVVEIFSDISLAMGAQFCHYLPRVMAALVPASQTALTTAAHAPDDLDRDTVAFLCKLQQHFLSTYMAFVALCHDDVAAQVAPYFQPMVEFAAALMQDPELITTTLSLAAELVHDVCSHAKEAHPSLPDCVVQWGAPAVVAKAIASTKKKARKSGQKAKSAMELMLS